ncbi:glycerol dehydratase reactivase beta/small subunit family protein [Geodermatophilus sp. DSM 45219]|uniref:glycerol dehydratase reactivase beta/small subunit family protein n=1 Tax=Geodermatophilus sp. DSM 45219 TaxID=1881103 RepID=UPI00088C5B25|nr:glycerol dehydratase reactivase beta/small subunit family protein [Geodermatophilus sp. DSM 45219]SDN57734.1 Dehydratase medium subunit [Geodermatophilus sp. DSM 45219]
MPDRVTEPGPRPAVLVYRHPGAPTPVLRQVCAGVEEEGVPTDVVDVPGPDDAPPPSAVALAHAAAGESRLGVGIGLDSSGAAAVHHGTLPEGTPVDTTPARAFPSDWRRVGRTAARVVKHLPLG